MGRYLEFLSFGLVSVCLLWKGLQCDPAKYKINAPEMVSVQEGLCIIIPCNFTYDTNDADPDSPLYGYWYEQGADPRTADAVASNRKKAIAAFAKGRFNISEEVEQGNCSLIIRDARETDQKTYYFRMEKERHAKFSYYPQSQQTVSVTKLQKPKIQMPGMLHAGLRVNITCIAPESCSLKRAHVSWRGLPHQPKSGIPATQQNNPEDHISVLTFVLSAGDDGQELTCQVTYGEGPDQLRRNKTVRLNVAYPPQNLQINAEVMRSNKSFQNDIDSSQITVEQGDAVVLHCVVEGNPSPNMTWVKRTQPSGTLSLGNELQFLNVTAAEAGEYECMAQNTLGYAIARIQLSVAANDAWTHHVVNGVIGGLIMAGILTLIVATVLVSKTCRRKRKAVIGLESYTKQKTVHNKSSPVDKETKSIGLSHEEGKDVSEAQEKMEEGTDVIYSEPEEMYYASIVFNEQKSLPEETSKSPPTEYAEIKKPQSTDFAGNQEDTNGSVAF